ncbi:MAG: AraC family ligand binding domain-containing protein [Lachnotalea sp.]
MCGWEECLSGFRFGPYVRKYYTIHIILHGKGSYKTKYGEFFLEERDASYERVMETIFFACGRK